MREELQYSTYGVYGEVVSVVVHLEIESIILCKYINWSKVNSGRSLLVTPIISHLKCVGNVMPMTTIDHPVQFGMHTKIPTCPSSASHKWR